MASVVTHTTSVNPTNTNGTHETTCTCGARTTSPSHTEALIAGWRHEDAAHKTRRRAPHRNLRCRGRGI